MYESLKYKGVVMYNCYFRAYTMNPNIVFSIIGDVNGDRIPDYVFLTGISTPESPFIQNITLVVRDGRTGITTRVPLSENRDMPILVPIRLIIQI